MFCENIFLSPAILSLLLRYLLMIGRIVISCVVNLDVNLPALGIAAPALASRPANRKLTLD